MADFVLTINGAVVPMRNTFTITEVANGRNRLSARVYSPTGAVLAPLGAPVTLTEDGIRIFGGTLDAPLEAGAGRTPRTETQISVSDNSALAERRVVNLYLPTGTIRSWLTLLVGYLSPYGVTLDPAPITPALPDGPTMTGLNLQLYFQRLDEAFNQIAALTANTTTPLTWEVDYNLVLRMKAAAFTPAPFNVVEGDTHARGEITVERDLADYANRVLVLAGEGLQDVTESFTGNGATSTFNLNYTVSATRGYVTNAGVNELISDVALAVPYWVVTVGAPYTLSRRLSGAAAPPAVTAANAITFQYTAQYPFLAMKESPGGVYPDPPKIWERLLRAADVFDKATAQALADSAYAQFSQLPRTVKYDTLERGIHPGMTQTITVPSRHFTGTCLVVEVRIVNGRRSVTAVEGNQFTGTWREMIKAWNKQASGVSGSSVSIPSGGGGVSIGTGSGTPNYLPKWLTGTTLGDSLISSTGSTVTIAANLVVTGTISGSGTGLTNIPWTAIPGTLPTTKLPGFIGDVTAAAGSNNLQIAAGAVGDAEVAVGAGIAWSKISKSGAVLSDLGGTLPWPQLPTGLGAWVATPIIDGLLTITDNLFANVAYTSSIGQMSKKFLALHAAELWVETLVAQHTIATIGGRVLVAPTNILTADAGSSDTGIIVKYNNFANGDRVYLEAEGKLEWMAIASGPSGTPGAYAYSVTRDLDGTGGNIWYAGDAVLNTGTTGKGFIDLYALSGILSGAGPTIVGNVRTGTAYNAIAPRWAIGNLNGLYGYATEVYGAAFGDPAGAWLKIDPTYGFRIGHNTTTMASIDASGNATFSGTIRVGPSPFGAYITLSAIDSYGGAAIFDAAVHFDHSVTATQFLGQSFLMGTDANDLSGTGGLFANPYLLGVGYKLLSVRRYPDVGAVAQIVLMPAGTSEWGNGVAVNGPLVVGSAAKPTSGYALDARGAVRVATGLALIATLQTTNTDGGYLHFPASGYVGSSKVITGVGGAGDYEVFSLGALILTGTTTMRFYASGVLAAQIDANRDFMPGSDNTRFCGVPSLRWAAIYAANGTIQTSDVTLKEDVRPDELGLPFVLALQPKSWRWAGRADPKRYYGLIAQDVAAALGERADIFGGLDRPRGAASGLNYSAFIAPLVSSVQALDARLRAIERTA